MVNEVKTYIPERGDLVWLQFDPQTGHEQAGRRPALVISPQLYNGKVGWPFSVLLLQGRRVILLK